MAFKTIKYWCQRANARKPQMLQHVLEIPAKNFFVKQILYYFVRYCFISFYRNQFYSSWLRSSNFGSPVRRMHSGPWAASRIGFSGSLGPVYVVSLYLYHRVGRSCFLEPTYLKDHKCFLILPFLFCFQDLDCSLLPFSEELLFWLLHGFWQAKARSLATLRTGLLLSWTFGSRWINMGLVASKSPARLRNVNDGQDLLAGSEAWSPLREVKYLFTPDPARVSVLTWLGGTSHSTQNS